MISIHTSLAGSDLGVDAGEAHGVHISIHTSLAGSDLERAGAHLLVVISIHTSLAGSDPLLALLVMVYVVFQSTLPLREVTKVRSSLLAIIREFQSTLPLREVTFLPASE